MLAGLFAVSCCNCKKLSRAYAQLDNHAWQVIELSGDAVASAGEEFTLNFDKTDHKVFGMGACNRFFGTYSVGAKNYLTFTGIGSTRMACPDMDAESKFFMCLSEVNGYKVDGDMLMLLKDGANVATLKVIK